MFYLIFENHIDLSFFLALEMEENSEEDVDTSRSTTSDSTKSLESKSKLAHKRSWKSANLDEAMNNLEIHPQKKQKTSLCTCSLKLGVYPLSTLESQYCKVLEDIENMTINFHGPADSNEQLKVKEKIDEIKEKIPEYYFDKNCQVIAIPNTWKIPKNPSLIGLPNRKAQDEDFFNKHCEELLHHEIVKYAREKKKECIVLNGFHSQDFLKLLIDKAKSSRANDFAELNKFEKEIKDILNIKDISVEKLLEALEEHGKWKNNKLDKKDAKSWVFIQELILYN